MLQLCFTQEDKQALHFQRYNHPHPHVQRKMEALWLKSQGLPHKQIAQLVGVTPNTLRHYLRAYQSGGVGALTELGFYRPQSELAAHRETLEAYFQKHPCTSINQAAAVIEQITGIKRGPTQVRLLLKNLGLARRKVAVIPAKADIQEQVAFKKTH